MKFSLTVVGRVSSGFQEVSRRRCRSDLLGAIFAARLWPDLDLSTQYKEK